MMKWCDYETRVAAVRCVYIGLRLRDIGLSSLFIRSLTKAMRCLSSYQRKLSHFESLGDILVSCACDFCAGSSDKHAPAAVTQSAYLRSCMSSQAGHRWVSLLCYRHRLHRGRFSLCWDVLVPSLVLVFKRYGV